MERLSVSVNGEILGIDECFVEESRKGVNFVSKKKKRKGVNFMGWPFSHV